MKFNQIFHISDSLRYIFTIILLCGSLLTVYSLIKVLSHGGNMIPLLIGMTISVACIVFAAIPVKER